MAGKFTAPQQTQDVQGEYLKKKKVFEEAFVEFNTMFVGKVLDRNKSAAVKKTEVSVVDKLVNACVALNKINNGEGLLALAVLTLRESLTLRDRINELEYMLLKTQKEVDILKSPNVPPSQKKEKDEPKKP